MSYSIYQYNSLVRLPAFRHQSQWTLPPGFTGEWMLQNNPTHQVHSSIIPSLHFSQSLPHSWHPILSFYNQLKHAREYIGIWFAIITIEWMTPHTGLLDMTFHTNSLFRMTHCTWMVTIYRLEMPLMFREIHFDVILPHTLHRMQISQNLLACCSNDNRRIGGRLIEWEQRCPQHRNVS